MCACMPMFGSLFRLCLGFALYCKGLYMLHFGEMALKRVHYYFKIKIKIKDFFFLPWLLCSIDKTITQTEVQVFVVFVFCCCFYVWLFCFVSGVFPLF